MHFPSNYLIVVFLLINQLNCDEINCSPSTWCAFNDSYAPVCSNGKAFRNVCNLQMLICQKKLDYGKYLKYMPCKQIKRPKIYRMTIDDNVSKVWTGFLSN